MLTTFYRRLLIVLGVLLLCLLCLALAYILFHISSYNNSALCNPCKGYLVNSPACQIPDVDPWHESIREYIWDLPPVTCSSLPPLTRVEGRTLKLERQFASLYTSRYSSQLQCCYGEITREVISKSNEPDDEFRVTDCLPFQDSVNLTSEQQFIFVKCNRYSSYRTPKEIYTNLHATVPVIASVQKKLKKNTTDKKMSVLIFGIDSISRLNLIRKMPKTVEYLQKTKWIEMMGYNKMAGHTFSNLMAILTGMNLNDVTKTCWKTQMTFLDNCPFIWKNFSSNGYITCYAEDQIYMSTFNFIKVGFQKPPVDFYLRPFMSAAENFTQIKYIDGYLKACVGPTLETDHVYKYATDFANTFKDEKYFGLFWINTLSHNDVNRPSSLDHRNLQFLQDLATNGALNNSFVIFLSDHGMRFGDIRKTPLGWLEERLPFIYLWVPEWYRKLFPEKYSNMLANRNRLTSPFDLHLTLQEVLQGTNPQGSMSCPECLSMFDKIPHNRSCLDAGITKEWCTCSSYQNIEVDNPFAWSMAEFTVGEINIILKNNKDHVKSGYQCSELGLKKISSVRNKVSSTIKSDEFIITFTTVPGEAMFEAMFVGHENHFKLYGTISRINIYGNQSLCAVDPFLRLYCFCVRQ